MTINRESTGSFQADMYKKFLLLLSITVLAVIITTYSFSKENESNTVRFKEFTATTSDNHLILFGTVDNNFNQEMLSGLKSGVPIHFSFFIKLIQEKSRSAPETELTTFQFRHIMSYDTLKDSYRVILGELNNRVMTFTDIEEAKRTMSEVNGIKVIPLAELTQNSSYRLQIRADLFEKTLPLSLHRILPFLSWWDQETSWHTFDFNY